MDINIQHIARLAHLEFSDEQLSDFRTDMDNIVNMVKELPDADTAVTSFNDSFAELREDKIVDNEFTRAEMLANAPIVQHGCIAVPKTVE